MSELQIIAVKLDAVLPHPNADKLDLLRLGSYTVCDGKNKYLPGDVVAHFPPDMLIPNPLAKQLGVENYLKEAIYPGDYVKSKCRVAAIRLRGCPSFGFVLKVDSTSGDDLTERFHGVKYEPPEPTWYTQGLQARGDPRFHCYTEIENYRNSRYAGAIPIGMEVRITEKIHGTNSRIGIIDGEFMCGSHKTVMQETDKLGHQSTYWGPLYNNPNLRDMLSCLEEGGHSVIAFGEIFGSKVQFMDYGIVGRNGYRLFDISLDGVYLPWEMVEYYTTRFCVPTVPLLYKGPFNNEIVEQYVDGITKVTDTALVSCKFVGREGVVITPLVEQYSDILGGRMIVKAVSVDYLEKRKTDSH